jgi:trehalose/maltose hydrolase-like predicted phosphorylase
VNAASATGACPSASLFYRFLTTPTLRAKRGAQRNFEFYDPLTTGDSSLSSCIEAIVALEIGEFDKAVSYARAVLLMDLADVGGNIRDGCHIASMGGTWMVSLRIRRAARL